MEAMRKKLTEFINYEEGRIIRKALHEKSKSEYKPKYSDQYLEFMNDNPCTFDVNGWQNTNHPYYLTLFTCKSQHVMGDCVEECLDKAIEA